jgi:hypothetical protein
VVIAAMEIIRPATEDEMVLAFLRAERDSSRYGSNLKAPNDPAVDIYVRKLILNPNLASDQENRQRRQLLGNYRGYNTSALFLGHPLDVEWHLARLTIDELRTAKYANHATWLNLSGGTRVIEEGARNVDSIDLPENTNAVIRKIAVDFADHKSFAELIFLAEPGAAPDDLILIEGHSRATAYIYAAENGAAIPDALDVLVGYSDQLQKWHWF